MVALQIPSDLNIVGLVFVERSQVDFASRILVLPGSQIFALDTYYSNHMYFTVEGNNM